MRDTRRRCRARQGRTSVHLHLGRGRSAGSRATSSTSAKRQLPGFVSSVVDREHPDGRDGSLVEQARLELLEQHDLRAECCRAQRQCTRKLGAGEFTEHVSQRTSARSPLANSRQLGDAPRVARREAVPDPMVSFGTRPAPFEPRTGVWTRNRRHAPTVGRGRSRPPQTAGRPPKGFLKIPLGRPTGTRHRARSDVARPRRIGLDLRAQVRDVDMQVVRLDLVRGPPDLP